MTHVLVLLLTPMWLATLIWVLVAKSRSRRTIITWFVVYLVVVTGGTGVYAWVFMPSIRTDSTELLSLVALIAFQRSFEWWVMKLGALFKAKWNACQ